MSSRTQAYSGPSGKAESDRRELDATELKSVRGGGKRTRDLAQEAAEQQHEQDPPPSNR